MRVVLTTIVAKGYTAPPYGIMALAAYVRTNCADLDDNVEVIPLPFSFTTSARHIALHLKARHPDVVGISCYAWNYLESIELAKSLRGFDPNVFIVIGGPQVSPDDDKLIDLEARGIVNCLVLGDGETALRQILSGLIDARSCMASEAIPIRGWINGGSVDLNCLPLPYEALNSLRADLRRTKLAFVQTTRGCPYSCSFCDQALRKVRMRDAERVKRDLAFLHQNGARRVIFFDSTFNLKRSRTLDILDYVKYNLPGLSIHISIKPEILSDEEIVSISNLDGTTVEIGIQTAERRTLKDIKRSSKIDEIGHNVNSLWRAGVHVILHTIYGLPGEGLAEWKESLDYCYSLGDVDITAFWMKILPNTRVRQEERRSDYRYSEANSFSITSSDRFTREELALAKRMTQFMNSMHALQPSDRSRLRKSIETTHEGKLSNFLQSRLS
ncbi:B12-binding domain-containing radical SAM protein [Rhodopseudomonas palustris]|uniref:Radical SAM protein n=1 Tax=Rhodopseudomonas palustris TaxID=1076 RepID=A0A418VJH7_RHOPL|nr:radical SAM protein [Rhodopseudomonas palustris]RJF76310.1 radical SAM protein [Rhodopseudomonas palustris]